MAPKRRLAAARSLADLPVGASAVLGRTLVLDGTALRLLEMGMTEGVVVTLTRRAPFGDPLEIELRGTRLCLRKDDAAHFDLGEVTLP